MTLGVRPSFFCCLMSRARPSLHASGSDSLMLRHIQPSHCATTRSKAQFPLLNQERRPHPLEAHVALRFARLTLEPEAASWGRRLRPPHSRPAVNGRRPPSNSGNWGSMVEFVYHRRQTRTGALRPLPAVGVRPSFSVIYHACTHPDAPGDGVPKSLEDFPIPLRSLRAVLPAAARSAIVPPMRQRRSRVTGIAAITFLTVTACTDHSQCDRKVATLRAQLAKVSKERDDAVKRGEAARKEAASRDKMLEAILPLAIADKKRVIELEATIDRVRNSLLEMNDTGAMPASPRENDNSAKAVSFAGRRPAEIAASKERYASEFQQRLLTTVYAIRSESYRRYHAALCPDRHRVERGKDGVTRLLDISVPLTLAEAREQGLPPHLDCAPPSYKPHSLN